MATIIVEGKSKCTVVMHFFFSSRRRHTRLQGDWSSDVCSSDLPLSLFRQSIITLCSIGVFVVGVAMFGMIIYLPLYMQAVLGVTATRSGNLLTPRSEERRVGKSVDLGGRRIIKKKKRETMSEVT